MTQRTKTFDLIIMGATGFTGRLVAEHIETHGGPINWAIAGRNEAKLQSIQSLQAMIPRLMQLPKHLISGNIKGILHLLFIITVLDFKV